MHPLRSKKVEQLEHPSEKKLEIVTVATLRAILRDDIKNETALNAMEKLPNSDLCDEFAYDVELLKEFSYDHNTGNTASVRQASSRQLRRSGRVIEGGSLRSGNVFGARPFTREDDSIRSARSFRRQRTDNALRNDESTHSAWSLRSS